jgi:hypothetical protein
MNPRELVDHIHSGPAELTLDTPLRFRRRTRSNPCDFNDFLQALQSSETIRMVVCGYPQELGITEDEWVLLVKTLGSIKGIKELKVHCVSSSRNFDPYQTVADAVNNAQSLCRLGLLKTRGSFPRDPSGLAALANALREHTVLQEFGWCDFAPETVQITALDPVLQALLACPYLQKVDIVTKCASVDAIQNLLQLRPATELSLMLGMEKYSAVANEIRRGRCNVQTLSLIMLSVTESEATEAVKALASAIQLDRNLERLNLEVVVKGPTEDAFLALAEALTVNTTLRTFSLSGTVHGFQSYEAFAKMLLVNTSLVLELPPPDRYACGERLFDSYDQMRIEQHLNKAGRGRLLASIQTTKEEWVDALRKLNYSSFNDSPTDDPDAMLIGCIFSLVRLNPEIVSMS